MYPWSGRNNTIENGGRPFFSNSFQCHHGTNFHSQSFLDLHPHSEPQLCIPDILRPSQLNISGPVPYLTNRSLCCRSLQENLHEKTGNLFSNHDLNRPDSSYPLQRDVPKFMFNSKRRSNIHGNSLEGADSGDDDIFGVQELSLQKSLSTKAKQTKSKESTRSVPYDRHVKKQQQKPRIENISSDSNLDEKGCLNSARKCGYNAGAIQKKGVSFKKNVDSKTKYSEVHFEENSVNKTIEDCRKNKQTRQVNGSGCTEVHSEENSVDKTIGKRPKNKQTLTDGSACSEAHSEEKSIDKTIGTRSKNKQTHQINRSACSEVDSEENSVDKIIAKCPKNKQTCEVNRSDCIVHSEENSVDIKEESLLIRTKKNKNEITNSTISKPIGQITPHIKKVTVKKKSKQTIEDDAKGDSMDMKANKSITRKRKEENGFKEMSKVTPKIKTDIENMKIEESQQLNSKTKQHDKRKYDTQHKKEEETEIKKGCSKIKTVLDIDDQSGFHASLPYEEMVFHQLQPGVLSTCAISAKDTTCGYILIQSNRCLISEMISTITFLLVKGSLTVIQNGKTYIVHEGSFIYISDNLYRFKNDTAGEVLLSYFKSN